MSFNFNPRVFDLKRAKISGQASTASVRVLWLQPKNSDQQRSQQLRNALTASGLKLFVLPSTTGLEQDWGAFSLIVIQVMQLTQAEIFKLVEQVRTHTRAPLVLLAEWMNDELLEAIVLGADAVVPLTATNEEIIAHLSALLRRWPPSA